MKDISKERIGKRNKMKNGMYAEIIDYIKYDDISVRFDDGTFVPHRRYDHFKNGDIVCPTKTISHIGETAIHGDKTYTIIKWRNNADIDFIDDTGVLYEHKTYYRFKHCSSFRVKNTNSSNHHIGERKQMNCGEFATIIDFDMKTKTITIKFDDGTIRENLQYSNFQTGRIGRNEYGKIDRTGETNIMSNGQKAVIIEYRKTSDIDIQFEDGTIVKNRQYGSFKNGTVQNPNKPACGFIVEGRKTDKSKYLHQKLLMNCGLECEIIDVLNSGNLTVQFENGEIREGVAYNEFNNRSVLPLSGFAFKYLGEENIMSNGQKAVIIAYRSNNDLDIQFEDGTIVCNMKYRSFQRGYIKNPNTPNPKSAELNRVGQTMIMNSGLSATIIRYASAQDYDVQFEDGIVVTSKNIRCFDDGEILHPVIGKSYQIKETEQKFLGKRKRMNNGIFATIIAYRNATDITVRFEDGTNVDTTIHSFRKGKVSHPLYVRNSESYNELFVASYFHQLGFDKATKGSLAEIDSDFCNLELDMYNPNVNGCKVAIEYDGGYHGHTRKKDLLKNKLCKKNGIILIRIREPQLEQYTYDNVKFYPLTTANLGSDELKKVISDIVCYINTVCKTNYVIDLELTPDIKTVDSYARLGECKKMNNGMKATIIAYRHSNDIDIQFEDGAISTNKTYSCFKSGCIGHPTLSYMYLTHINKTNVMTNGMVARIIAFRSHTDMDVEFEDGAIREHVSSESFNKGKIRHPLCGMDARSVRHRKERLGESKTCKDGRIATIIKYTKYDDIIVRFDDETEWNTSYQRFKLA